MSAGLIKHLRKKTDEDSNTKILMSQWEFDEKLVGKSLENVGSYYPHFSSHNESHSQQILVNIERLLGSNIDKLTATDTWLILEAAYWHDIGMLFSADEVQKVFDEDDFKEYVESLANDNTQDLHEFAKVWHEDGWNKALVNHSDPHTGVEKYRQMIAEWYRRGHAKNSNSVVLDPFEKLGITSPRTELLPKRIYRYLGQICWAHGRNFEEVMSLLPFRQTGMGTEDCHPRFVACLLRLGDLFDIDDNRFCPVMARQVGNMPSLSETHEQKHKAIREFQLDSETVSVTAICSTEMAYIECRNWFDWIKEEIQNQMSQWKNIVPSRDFGLLPTINKLDVEMTDKKILLNDKPMKFSLDERSAIELLQGNNLYKNDMSIYRELIQNSIDATMMRVWHEHKQGGKISKLPLNANPYEIETRKLFEKYPITLEIRKIEDNDKWTFWELIIKDEGIGISKKDLEYIQKIAGSNNNKEKQKVIREMPEWMRPSGEFGIGLHSAFLLLKNLPTEKQIITIFTKSRLTQESLKVELNSPLSGKAGYCFIEEIDSLGDYGTTIVLPKIFNKINTKNIENKIYGTTQSLYEYNIGHNFLAYLKKKGIVNKVTNPLITIANSYRPCNPIDNFFWDSENSAAISIKIYYEGTNSFNYQSDKFRVFFKGQHISDIDSFYPHNFKNKFLYLENFQITVDLYGLEASDILHISRDEFKDKNEILRIIDKIYSNLLKNITRNNNINLNSMLDGDLIKNSFFMRFNEFHKNIEYLDDNWLNFKVYEGISFKDLFNCNAFSNTSNQVFTDNLFSDNKIDNYLCINSSVISYLENYYRFSDLAIKEGFNIYEVEIKLNSDTGEEIYFSKEKIYSKVKIDFSITENIFLVENIVKAESKKSLDDYLNQMEHTLAQGIHISKFTGIHIISDASTLDKPFYTEKIDYENIHSLSRNGIDIILMPPYFINHEYILEIPCCDIYLYLEEEIDISYDVFLQIYSDIKDHVLNKARNEHNEWYEAYLRGKDFERKHLRCLDKFYKPIL